MERTEITVAQTMPRADGVFVPQLTEKQLDYYFDTRLKSLDPDPMRWIVSINCLPCKEVGGFFVPTHEDIISGIGGDPTPHPINNFRRAVAGRSLTEAGERLRRTIERRGITDMVVLLDDLDVKENWVLPPAYSPFQAKLAMAAFTEITDTSYAENLGEAVGAPITIAPLSNFLDTQGRSEQYSNLYRQACDAFVAKWPKRGTTADHDHAQKLLVGSYTTRKIRSKIQGVPKHALEKGPYHEELIRRTAHRLGGYAAQGAFVEQLGSTYLLLYDYEARYMQQLGAVFPIVSGFESTW